MQNAELTELQIERQDFVDNEIQNLINRLNPSNKAIDWNIEYISRIRDTIKDLFTQELSLCDENTFYPFLQE
jgi:hypothetical protein